MGEVLYPILKCRPDMSAHAILLSQYMNDPGEEHYMALKSLITYLVATSLQGIHYWRSQPNDTLLYQEPPPIHIDNYVINETRCTNSQSLIASVDLDWATHVTKRTSLMGIVLMYAGGTVGYKT